MNIKDLTVVEIIEELRKRGLSEREIEGLSLIPNASMKVTITIDDLVKYLRS